MNNSGILYFWRVLFGCLLGWNTLTIASMEQTVIQQLIQQAKQTEQQMQQEDLQRLQQFKQQYQTQLHELAKTERYLANLKQQLKEAEDNYAVNQQLLRRQQQELQQERKKYQELFNEIRHFGRQLIAQIQQTPFYGASQKWLAPVIQLVKQDRVIGAIELRALWLAYLEWIQLSAGIQRCTLAVIHPNGEEKLEEVTYIGPFSLYSVGNWLTYLPESQHVMVIAPQPNANQFSLRLLKPNQEGRLNVLIDPQHGKLMKQLVIQPTWLDELKAGGIVGVIIIVLGLAALSVVIERMIRLKRITQQNIKINSQQQLQLLDELNGLEGELIEGRLSEELQRRGSVLHKGVGFISTVATIAPLLGLLGTVIGMIDTFQALMLYGNESPAVLSGGISKALVTTELGLIVSIPLVLLHSQLQAMIQRIQNSDEQFYTQIYVEILQNQRVLAYGNHL